MSTKHLFIRKFKNSGYSGFDQGIDSGLLEFLIYCFILIPLSNDPDFTLTWTDLMYGSLAGILVNAGRVLIAVGVAEGLASPA